MVDNTRRNYALTLAAKGFNILPLPPKQKTPYRASDKPEWGSWKAIMTFDPAIINAWFDEVPDINYGVCPGDHGVVVDLDVKDDKNGIDNFYDLNSCQPGDCWCINTFIVNTPSGGRHLYMRTLYAVGNRNRNLPAGVDIRGASGYVVGPGCITEELREPDGKIKVYGGTYTPDNDCEMCDAPQWLLDKLDRHYAPAMTHQDALAPLDLEDNIACAKEFLSTRTPAIEGSNGDDWTFGTIAKVKDFGISEDKAFALVTLPDGWNSRCVPPWSGDALWEKVQNAYRYGKNPPGTAATLYSMPGAPTPEEYMQNAQKEPSENDDDRPLSAAELVAGTFPSVEFLVDRLLIKDVVNLLYGDGGTGKTTLALQIAVAIASGTPLFGIPVKQAPVLALLAEDTTGAAKERLLAICANMGLRLEKLPLNVWCRVGKDSALAVIDEVGKSRPCSFHSKLQHYAEHQGPGLLILDSLSDIAMLDETKRLPVNTLCKQVLGGFCRGHGKTVLVLGHPSKASMDDGTMYAGSTAWNNAVRNRLALEFVGSEKHMDPRRKFSVAKSNYAPSHTIDLQLDGGVFRSMDEKLVQQQELIKREQVFKLFSELLTQGKYVNKANGSGVSFKVFSERFRERFETRASKSDVRHYFGELERAGRIEYRRSDKNSCEPAGYRLVSPDRLKGRLPSFVDDDGGAA